MERSADLAVVGAGPAGARVAELLAAQGARVVVFDPRAPWEKPCGGGLTPPAFDEIPELEELPLADTCVARPPRPDHRSVGIGVPNGTWRRPKLDGEIDAHRDSSEPCDCPGLEPGPSSGRHSSAMGTSPVSWARTSRCWATRRGVAYAIEVSKATMRNAKQSLLGAFVYNPLGIPIAAGILYPLFGLLLSPLIAGAAMAASSVTVVSNANRLRLFKARSFARSSSQPKEVPG